MSSVPTYNVNSDRQIVCCCCGWYSRAGSSGYHFHGYADICSAPPGLWWITRASGQPSLLGMACWVMTQALYADGLSFSTFMVLRNCDVAWCCLCLVLTMGKNSLKMSGRCSWLFPFSHNLYGCHYFCHTCSDPIFNNILSC